MSKTIKKISCIDIGSNAIKYRQYRLTKNDSIELDTFKRIPLRLGADAFSLGKMSDKTYEEFKLTLKKLKKHSKKKNSELLGIFATSAMRTFSNQSQILKKIKKDLNLKIDVLSGREEASLLRYFEYKEFKKTQTLLVDVGGGSTEICRISENEETIESFQLGGVRILNKLDKEKNWNELGSFLKQIDTEEIRNIIGVGGNAKLIIQAANSVNDYLTFEELKETKITLENKSTKEMVTEMNFPEDRADIIEHAAAIFEFIQRRFVKANFYASNWSISDGFMLMKKNLYQATSLEAS